MTTGAVCFTDNACDYWDYFLCHFAPDPIFVLGTRPASLRKALREAVYINSLADLPEELSLVLLAPSNGLFVQGQNSLDTFTHPEKAVYLFGADNDSMKAEIFADRKPDHSIFIPTKIDLTMHAHVAASITFWDRMLTHG